MSHITLDPDAIHADVQSYYGERARSLTGCYAEAEQADGDCCSTEARLYSAEELAQLPEAVTQGSWGCGNPTALASLQPGEVVVDLGSGGGLDVFLAAKKVGPGGFVYGIDMTDDMLALAQRNAERGGFSNVAFRKGQIESLPLADETADVIISNCVINLSPDKGQTLKEAYRVLKPGGHLAVSDIVIDGTLDDLPVGEEQVRAALRWAGCIAGALTMDQFRSLLAEAGFEDIRIDVTHRHQLADLGQDMASVAAVLSSEAAEQLAHRFTSCNIWARRPS